MAATRWNGGQGRSSKANRPRPILESRPRGGRGGKGRDRTRPINNWMVEGRPDLTPGRPGKAAPAGGAGGSSAAVDPWDSEKRSAYEELEADLASYGLGSLLPQVKQWLLDGVDPKQVPLKLQNTNEFKQRFKGNEMLKERGLGVLDPGQYLAQERAYTEVMKQYGLPAGFYDDPDDFAKFIGGSVSPAEVQSRAQMYADLANRDDSATRDQLLSMGLTEGDILAYTMDPDRAAPLVQEKYQTTILGSAARRSGFVADNKYLTSLAERGVTEQQASEGYGAIAAASSGASLLSSIYDDDYDADDMQAEIFENSGAAGTKRKRLASQERAAFGGATGTAAGALRRNTSGSF